MGFLGTLEPSCPEMQGVWSLPRWLHPGCKSRDKQAGPQEAGESAPAHGFAWTPRVERPGRGQWLVA